MKKLISVALAVMLLAGCASVRNPDAVARSTHVTQDDYNKTVIYRGKRFNAASASWLRPWADDVYVHLRLVRTEDHGIARQLVIEFDESLGWGYYGTAYDFTGYRLNVNGLGAIAPCPNRECFFSDTVAVSLPPGYLEAHVVKGQGLNIKLYGLFGEKVVKVPAGYVAGFVQAKGFNR